MNLLRFMPLVALAWCALAFGPLPAQDAISPFGLNKAFTADIEVTTAKGEHFTPKVYSDGGKVRAEMERNGMAMITIIRPDQQKAYMLLASQKMAMEMPYVADKYKQLMAATTGPDGKVELVGPDTVEGVACTKYKVTAAKENKIYFFWIDVATKAPVKMAADDGSVTVLWKNYKAGPQDPALFEVPQGYTLMSMPGGPAGGSGP